MVAWVFMAALIALPLHSAYADMYKYVREDGTVVFTDSPHTVEAEKVRSSPGEPSRRAAAGEDYDGIISRKAEKYRVDPSLVRAVITAESGFNASAVSEKGAIGLMQLMPSTAVDMGSADPFDPEDNIEAGVRYLSALLERFSGDLELALAAYNAGPANVEKYGAVPPIEETRNYIDRVFSIYDGARYVPRRPKLGRTIYKMTLEDGTVLYTDSPFTQKGAGRN